MASAFKGAYESVGIEISTAKTVSIGKIWNLLQVFEIRISLKLILYHIVVKDANNMLLHLHKNNEDAESSPELPIDGHSLSVSSRRRCGQATQTVKEDDNDSRCETPLGSRP